MTGYGTIRARLAAMVVIPLVALVLSGLAAGLVVAQVRVGGPADQRIDASQDLVADVLPPPLYIVEAYATVLQVSSKANAADRDELLNRLQQLETEFRQRDAVWRRDLQDAGLRRALLEDAYEPAVEFFSLVDDQLAPLVRAGSYADAQGLANGRLTALYEQHRLAVDDVVRQSRAERRVIEDRTAASARRLALLAVAALLGLLALTLMLGLRIARSITRPVTELRRVALTDLPAVIERVKEEGFQDGRAPVIDAVPVTTRDEFADVATSFNAVVRAAVDLAGEQARLRQNTSDTFVNLGRRNQNLVARQLRAIDAMQLSETEPERLQRLFHLDHMATRMRRNAESLLVLAGLEAPRKWKQPVSVADVARASLAEVEQYERVSLAVLQPAMLPGYMIADMTHIIAELVENALRYSPPDSTVTITGGFLPDCYQIAVIDQGMGLPPRELEAANARLRASEGFGEAPTAHLGLYVVARLARRHDLHVELESDGGYGSTVYVTVPLGTVEQAQLPAERMGPVGRSGGVVVALPAARPGEPARQAASPRAAPTTALAVVGDASVASRPDERAATGETGATDVAGVTWRGHEVPDDLVRAADIFQPSVAVRWAASSDDTPVPAADHAGADLRSDDPGVTRTGLPRRSSKLGRGQPSFSGGVAASGPVRADDAERRPDQVRALYDGFNSGRRRARPQYTAPALETSEEVRP